METLYDWLLHNTGNAGNYFTILNTQRDGIDSLEVMARSSDFTVVNVSVHGSENAGTPNKALSKTAESNYVFADEQQLIDFFATGKAPESQSSGDTNSIQVVITETDGAAGAVTFPTA